MSIPNQAEKLKLIYQLLFDLATGRKTVTPDSNIAADEYDEIIYALTKQGERIRTLVLDEGMVTPYSNFEHLSEFIFVLDSHYRIIDFNFTVVDRLKYRSEALPNLSFETLLTDSSKLIWKAMLQQADMETTFFITTELVFVAFDGLKLPLFCSITNGKISHLLYVLSAEVVLKDSPFLKHIPCFVSDKIKLELAAVENIHTYILDHLDAPLPSLKSLALLFGCEEHKVRHGFRQQYDMSIYQFYQEERLKKAYLLISQTDLPLKEISYQCGFSMYLNFYKAFRKKYGFSPSEVMRK
jgi:AraC-like DNA-binding protein